MSSLALSLCFSRIAKSDDEYDDDKEDIFWILKKSLKLFFEGAKVPSQCVD